MKTKHSEHVSLRISKSIYKVIFSFVIIIALVLIIPGEYHKVYAAPLEDCDLDGFDDATGVPVPWPGYDETKGDTPDGPAGSKTTNTTPSNTNNSTSGNTKIETPGETSSGDSGKTSSEESGNISKTNTSKTNSSKAGKTNEESEKNNKTSKVKTDKTISTDKDITNKEESGKKDSKTSNKMNAARVSDKMNQSGAADEAKNSVPSEDQEETTQDENEQPVVASNNNNNADISADEIESVIQTKGMLKIADATGSIIHAGSSVIISGSGFTGNIQDLEIVIQSEPRQLGTVKSTENGSFEAKLNIPENLEAGEHHIVVLYHGKEITRQLIKVGPKAANSFLEALSVGFTKDNNGLMPGLLILLGLFVIGGIVLGASALIGSSKNKN